MKTETHGTGGTGRSSRTQKQHKDSSVRVGTRRRTPTMADVMTAQPYTIGRHETLETAHAMMREHHIRHLPVLEHGEIVGIVSQRDLYFMESLGGVDVGTDEVNEAMSQDSYVVS